MMYAAVWIAVLTVALSLIVALWPTKRAKA